MRSNQNQNRHRGRPSAGAKPPFSQRLLREIIITIILFLIIIVAPALQFSTQLARATNQNYPVAIVDYNFQPLHINITTGTTVVWTYPSSGKDYHTVTSNPGTNKTQGATPLLNSGSLSPGQSFSYTFTQPGYYPYQCSFHPTLMNGWVNVTGSPVTPPPPSPPPNYTLLIMVVGVVALVIVATVVLFVRRKNRRASVTSAPTQSVKP